MNATVTRLLTTFLLLASQAMVMIASGIAAENNEAADENTGPFEGLAWRNIGPAFMSGRIADIDWDPNDDSVWYVGVGSGGGLEDRECWRDLGTDF